MHGELVCTSGEATPTHGEGSLQFYLLLGEAGPSVVNFIVFYLLCLVPKKLT